MKYVKRFLFPALLAGIPLFAQPAQAQPYVCMETNIGEFCLDLFQDSAPGTVANFLNYVEDGDYDETFIHRSVPDFVIQGGGYYYDPIPAQVPADPAIANEFGASNSRATIAMAKVAGDPDSATSQWFINLQDNFSLNFDNGGFTVFGEVVSGMEVVDRIGVSQRANLSAALGSTAFGTVPVLDKPPGGIRIEDFVQVQRVYVAESVELPQEPVTTLQGGSFTLPVRIGANLYQASLNRVEAEQGFVFRVDNNALMRIEDTGQQSAHYSNANFTLSIPSVQSGNLVFTDVVLRMTDRDSLEFTLVDHTPPQ